MGIRGFPGICPEGAQAFSRRREPPVGGASLGAPAGRKRLARRFSAVAPLGLHSSWGFPGVTRALHPRLHAFGPSSLKDPIPVPLGGWHSHACVAMFRPAQTAGGMATFAWPCLSLTERPDAEFSAGSTFIGRYPRDSPDQAGSARQYLLTVIGNAAIAKRAKLPSFWLPWQVRP